MINYQKRLQTLVKMFGEERLNLLFKHIEKNYDALFRLQGGQLDNFVIHMKNEMERTQRFSGYNTLANDQLGYDAIRVLAVLTHHCQQCAEDPEAWHTREAFCTHKLLNNKDEKTIQMP